MEESRNQALAGCAQFDGELEAYLEGEARPFIASHSHHCGSCAALLADLQAIRQAAQELPLQAPSAAVWSNVRARLEAEGAIGIPACVQFDAGLEAIGRSLGHCPGTEHPAAAALARG